MVCPLQLTAFTLEPSTGVERRGRERVTGSLWNVNSIINFLSTFWFRYSLENTIDQPKGFTALFFTSPQKVSKFDPHSFPLASDRFTNYLFIWAFPSFLKCKETGQWDNHTNYSVPIMQFLYHNEVLNYRSIPQKVIWCPQVLQRRTAGGKSILFNARVSHRNTGWFLRVSRELWRQSKKMGVGTPMVARALGFSSCGKKFRERVGNVTNLFGTSKGASQNTGLLKQSWRNTTGQREALGFEKVLWKGKGGDVGPSGQPAVRYTPRFKTRLFSCGFSSLFAEVLITAHFYF